MTFDYSKTKKKKLWPKPKGKTKNHVKTFENFIPIFRNFYCLGDCQQWRTCNASILLSKRLWVSLSKLKKLCCLKWRSGNIIVKPWIDSARNKRTHSICFNRTQQQYTRLMQRQKKMPKNFCYHIILNI